MVTLEVKAESWLGRDLRELSGVTEMFYMVKIHQTVLSRALHPILCKLDLNKEKT